jgi:hypothetical protein
MEQARWNFDRPIGLTSPATSKTPEAAQSRATPVSQERWSCCDRATSITGRVLP